MTKLLTAQIKLSDHRKIRVLAKQKGIPVRILATLLLEAGLEDLTSGRIQIATPKLEKSA